MEIPSDFANGDAKYRKRAGHGYAASLYSLGVMFEYGRGVPQDITEAVMWYRKSAERGCAPAQSKLGGAYLNGQGVPRDYREAASWYNKAAEQGDPIAQFNLGAAFCDGQGLPQDYAEAYYWLSLAAMSEPESINAERLAKMRDDAASHLDSVAIAKVLERSHNWSEDRALVELSQRSPAPPSPGGPPTEIPPKDNKATTITFPDKTSALAEKALWAKLLPKVPSAYRPSGYLSPIGWLVLPSAGLAAGIIAATVSGTIAASLAGCIAALGLRLPLKEEFLWALFQLVGLGSLLVLCTFPGLFGPLGMGIVSKAVKNRNVPAEGTVGVISAAIGALVLCRWVLPVVAGYLLPLFPLAPEGDLRHSLFLNAYLTIESVARSGTAMWFTICCVGLSSFVGFKNSVAFLTERKFCEHCSLYMRSRRLSSLSLEDAVRFAGAIEGSDLSKAGGPGMSSNGPACLTVFECSKCGAGYLEADVTFCARWPVPGKNGKYTKLSKSWLAASSPITASQIAEVEGAATFFDQTQHI